MAYRDHERSCPVCRAQLITAGALWSCPGCRGAWLTAARLTDMIADLHDGAETEALALAPRPGDAQRACPDCNRPMAAERLEGHDVERCAAHGIWFDGGELERVLHHAVSRPPRAVGLKVDLSPLPSNVRHGGHTQELVDRHRERELARWMVTSMPAIEAQLRGVTHAALESALTTAQRTLGTHPDDQRPSPEITFQLDAALEATTSPHGPALIAALRPWCWAHALLATALTDHEATASHLTDYLDTLTTRTLPALSILALSPPALASATADLHTTLRHQRDLLATIFAASNRNDTESTATAVTTFVAALPAVEDAAAGLLARIAGLS